MKITFVIEEKEDGYTFLTCPEHIGFNLCLKPHATIANIFESFKIYCEYLEKQKMNIIKNT